MGRRVGLGAGLGVLLVVIVLVVILSQRVEHRTGTNASTNVSGVAVAVPASRERCQRSTIPAHTQRITVFGARRRGGGPLQIRISTEGRVVSRARIEAFPAERPYAARLRPGIRLEISNARVCFDNDGSRNLAFGGNRTPPIGAGNPNQVFPDDDIRTDFSEAEHPSRIALAGDVARRLPLQKPAVLGTWTLWAALAIVLASSAVGVRLLLGESRA